MGFRLLFKTTLVNVDFFRYISRGASGERRLEKLRTKRVKVLFEEIPYKQLQYYTIFIRPKPTEIYKIIYV